MRFIDLISEHIDVTKKWHISWLIVLQQFTHIQGKPLHFDHFLSIKSHIDKNEFIFIEVSIILHIIKIPMNGYLKRCW